MDAPLARTVARWLPDLWVVFFVLVVLTLPTGGRLQTRADRALVSVILFELLVRAPMWLVFTPEQGNVFLVVPHERLSRVVDTAQRLLFVAAPVATAIVLAARCRGAKH